MWEYKDMIEFGKKEEKQIRKCQDEFSEVVGATIIFLHKNGLKLDYIREMLHNSLDELVDMVEHE